MAGSVYQPTGMEQLFLELLNAARANPAAYGQSIGLDLSDVAPSQPLTFNLKLMQSARLHSQDMNNQNFFGHCTAQDPQCQNSNSTDPGDRIQAAGYDWRGYGESLAAGFNTPSEALRALIIDEGIPDLGHRRHLLAIDSISATLPEVGIGIVLDGSGAYSDYYTIDSARDYATSDPHDSFLTGVIYNDLDSDSFYSADEGYAALTVRAVANGSGAEFTATAFCSGGYSLELPAGSYTVTVSGGTWAGSQTATDVSIGSSNVKLDFQSAEPGAGQGCTPMPPAAAELGVWSGTWQIDANGNDVWDGAAGGDISAKFGKTKTDVPVPLDWDGDGSNDLAILKKGKTLQIDSNGNNRWDGKDTDTQITLGNGGDQAVVGDWDGDGTDNIGVFRNDDRMFHLDTNGDRQLGASDARFAFDTFQAGDVAISGDWNGDGTDEIGIFRAGNTFMLDSDGDRTWNPALDTQSTVAALSARPAIADYDGDGRSEMAVYSASMFQIDTDHDGTLDSMRTFRTGTAPVAGNWV
jgi:uncharacterized protein YkwD